ncbi:hypothetical protein H0H93_013608, partial [Arthromyces matolae]
MFNYLMLDIVRVLQRNRLQPITQFERRSSGHGKGHFRRKMECGKLEGNNLSLIYTIVALSDFEANSWIFAHPQNPTRDFFVLDATTTMDISTGPLFNGLGIRLDEPDAEPAWHPEEFVLVATFHTHPRL